MVKKANLFKIFFLCFMTLSTPYVWGEEISLEKEDIIETEPDTSTIDGLPIFNTEQLVEQLKLLQPVFLEKEVDELIPFESLSQNLFQLVACYDILVFKYEKLPTPEIAEQIIAINDIFSQMEKSFEQLSNLYVIDKHFSRMFSRITKETKSKNEAVDVAALQDAIQTQQQQIIQNLANTLQQSNETLEKITDKKHSSSSIGLTGVKIIAGAILVAIPFVIIAAAGAYVYYLQVRDDIRLDELDEEGKEIEDNVKKLHNEAKEIVVENNEIIKDNLDVAKEKMEGVKEMIDPLKVKMQDVHTFMGLIRANLDETRKLREIIEEFSERLFDSEKKQEGQGKRLKNHSIEIKDSSLMGKATHILAKDVQTNREEILKIRDFIRRAQAKKQTKARTKQGSIQAPKKEKNKSKKKKKKK